MSFSTLTQEQIDKRREYKLRWYHNWSKQNPIIAREKRKASKAKLRAKNPDAYKRKANGHADQWKIRNPEKSREVQRWAAVKYRTGATREVYAELLHKQNGVCAICYQPQECNLHVDHCHATGKIRGLLCGPCNRMLGMAKENEAVLVSAVEYIKTHRNAD